MNPGQKPSLSNMVMMMGLMYIGGTVTIDGEGTEDRRMILYVCTAVVHICQLLALWYVYKTIQRNNDKTMITVPAQKVMGQEVGEAKRMTVAEYDRSKVLEDLNQLLIGACIVGFITYKWDSHRPLLLNTMFAVNNAIEKPLYKIYLFGKPATGALKRPWAAPSMNPLGNLMGQQEQQQEQQEEQAQLPESGSSNSNKARISASNNDEDGPITPLTPNEAKRVQEGKDAYAAQVRKFEEEKKKGGKKKGAAAAVEEKEEEKQQQEEEELKRGVSQDDDVVVVASDEGEEDDESSSKKKAEAEEEEPAAKKVVARKRGKSSRAE